MDGQEGRGSILSERYKTSAMVDVEIGNDDPLMRGDWRYRAYRLDDWKLIETSAGVPFLFDVVAIDPKTAWAVGILGTV